MKRTPEQKHLKATYERSLVAKRRAEGSCTRCGKPRDSDYLTCQSCREKLRPVKMKWGQRQAEQGKCKQCSSPTLPGFKLCKAHQAKYNERHHTRRAQRIENGLCAMCGKFPSANATCGHFNHSTGYECEVCILKRSARRLWNDGERWTELALLLKMQCFRCPYTKRLLLPGINASIDHIVPVAKGGSNEIANLEWIDFDVNLMKRDHTKEEFLALVQEIATVAGC